MLRRNTLDRRLFGWLLGLTLVPALAVLLLATWLWSGALSWIGTLGPWDQVAASGRELFQAADSLPARSAEFTAALDRHRETLSASAVLARRWAYLGERVARQLPLVVIILSTVLGGVALLVSRRLARGLARPIEELVEWTERLGREEPIPSPGPAESRDTIEVRALRDALREAAAELARARARALEAERVRVWGEMARRVAHEMKNPLTPLRLAARRLAADGPRSGAALEVVQAETARLEALAARFAQLGRPPAGPTSAVDLGELLGVLLSTDVPEDVEVVLRADPGVSMVRGHYEALVRAFRNILRNAVEAVDAVAPPAPRRIEVALRLLPARPPAPAAVEVCIADSGPGLPPSLGDRIFEPDCTTKSRGTGLGLALVRQAVAAHGGDVTARNLPGGGAEFVVRLPALAGSIAAPLDGVERRQDRARV